MAKQTFTRVLGIAAAALLLGGCYNLAMTAGALVYTGIQNSAVDAATRNATGTTPASTVLGPASATPSATASPAGLSVAQWQTYQPPGTPLKAELPGPPSVQVLDVKWDSWTMKTTIAKVIVAGRYFGVSHAEFPAGFVESKGQKRLLDQRRDVAIHDAKATLRSEQPWSNGRASGREVILALPDGKTILVGRLVILEYWLFQAAYTGPIGTETSPDAVRFFEGFNPGAPVN